MHLQSKELLSPQRIPYLVLNWLNSDSKSSFHVFEWYFFHVVQVASYCHFGKIIILLLCSFLALIR